ncbi:polyphenol oxidase family protein [Psychromicrobium sp. YIM B11713]|uniref:polyphenol oxidase family protein n=1 Tax=Psychromicrobium sp. YIM B11713 TaxID=3145233 RepID=UPI00374E4C49
MFYWRSEARHGWQIAFSDLPAGSLSQSVPEDSRALENRESLRLELGLNAGFQFMSQVHGRDIVELNEPVDQPVADGLISAELSLAVMVADCLPVILLADTPKGTLAAAVHAGRRGVLNGILPRAVERLRAREGSNIEAWIGPAICGSCYEVPAEMRAESTAFLPELWAETSWGTPSLDLRAGATAQLLDCGARVNQVAVCTFETPELYSHRASGHSGRAEGRFAGLVYRTPTESTTQSAEAGSR